MRKKCVKLFLQQIKNCVKAKHMLNFGWERVLRCRSWRNSHFWHFFSWIWLGFSDLCYRLWLTTRRWIMITEDKSSPLQSNVITDGYHRKKSNIHYPCFTTQILSAFTTNTKARFHYYYSIHVFAMRASLVGQSILIVAEKSK